MKLSAASWLFTILCITASVRAADVTLARVPDAGVQPQALADDKGTVHLIYLKGDPAKSDIFYVRSSDGAKTWSQPMRVNSQPGSAIAMGTVRGAHVALGKDHRVHVAWMGSQVAEPKAAGKASPMLYTRMADDGKSFNVQCNVITEHVGLDGGGSIAADEMGNVVIAWHAPTNKGGEEADRRVWVTRSTDDGKTFAPESPLSPDATGACGCCGMRVFLHDGRVLALYRSATQVIHRDIYLLDAPLPAGTSSKPETSAQKVGPMEAGKCIMSTASFSASKQTTVAAWETDGQIEFGQVGVKSGKLDRPQTIPGKGGNRKHPSVAVAPDGRFLIAWAEGTGWNKGGAVAWQVFNADGTPRPDSAGRHDGLPAWGLPAAVAQQDGSFVLIY